MSAKFETQAVLDALGHGVLIFASNGTLIQHNIMAGVMLGRDLNLIKEQGWTVAAELLEVGLQSMDLRLNAVKELALQSERPVRFRIYRSGTYVPCSAAVFNGADGEVYTLLTLDTPDWTLVASVLDRFRSEMHEAVDSTQGHIRLINRTIKLGEDDEKDPAVTKVAKRIGGFTRLIDIHMNRAGRLIRMLDRLQEIRIGTMRDKVRRTVKQIKLEDFIEDFMEALDETPLLDPESEAHDYRARIKMEIDNNLSMKAAEIYLSYALREMLRNAIMYSMVGTSITIKAYQKQKNVHLDVVDEGYGVREKERDRIFQPFQRARQPQIIGEFGYGLALHLCRYEIEAMNGRLWFTSQEGVSTTFHLQLPAWDAAALIETSEAKEVSSKAENES